MLRRFGSVALLLALFASSPASDLRSTLNERYQSFNSAIKARDTKALQAWVKRYCSPDFSYKSKDKHTYKRAEFLEGLVEQNSVTTKVSSSTVQLGPVTLSGTSVKITTKTNFEGIVSFDGRALRLTDKSETVDTWIRKGTEWLLKSSVQTDADTQMYPE